jgi:integrase/recombinase XerD
MTNDSILVAFETFLLTEKRVSDNTFEAYKADIEQFIEFLNGAKTTLVEFNKRHLSSYLKWLKNQGIGARSSARKISSLKMLSSFMHDRFNLENRTESMLSPILEKRLPTFLTEEELARLLEAADADLTFKGIRNKVMLYLMYGTGLRISELVNVRLDDINFETGFIMVMGKGSKERSIPLPKTVLSLLSFYATHIYPKLYPENTLAAKSGGARSNAGHLFVSRYKDGLAPLSRQSFWMILKKLLVIANISKEISPHSLRHSLATHLLKKGADLRSLQLLLGHEQLTTVQIYTHLENSELRKVYDKKHPRS